MQAAAPEAASLITLVTALITPACKNGQSVEQLLAPQGAVGALECVAVQPPPFVMVFSVGSNQCDLTAFASRTPQLSSSKFDYKRPCWPAYSTLVSCLCNTKPQVLGAYGLPSSQC